MCKPLAHEVYEQVARGVTAVRDIKLLIPDRKVDQSVFWAVQQGWLIRTGRGTLALGDPAPDPANWKGGRPRRRGTRTAGLQEFLCRR